MSSVISVENLSKKYIIGHLKQERYTSLRDVLTDGASAEFQQWHFNIRGSNTEPLLRLNVEKRGDSPAALQHVHTIEALIKDAS